MELKSYQKSVLEDLERYLNYIQEDKDYSKAFNRLWEDRIGPYLIHKGTGMRPYQDNVPGVVHA